MVIAKFDTAESLLTITVLSFAVIGSVAGLTWKITRTLGKLMSIPNDVKEVVNELHTMNERIDGINLESQALRRESLTWHENHLKDLHSGKRKR